MTKDKAERISLYLMVVLLFIVTLVFNHSIKGMMSDIEEKNIQIDSIESKLEVNQEELNQKGTLIFELNNNIEKMQSEIDSQKSELDGKEKVISEYKSRIENEVRKRKQLENDIEKLKVSQKNNSESKISKVNQKSNVDSDKVVQASTPNTKNLGTFKATHYDAMCNTGCTGVTASGHNVKNTTTYKGMTVVAAPQSIPLYTKLRITYANGSQMTGIVLDRGGDIGSGRLDILVGSREEAYRLGVKQVKVEVIS